MSKRTRNRQLANDLSLAAFGTSLHDRQVQSYAPVPVAYINDASRIVRRDNILSSIKTWEQEERTRNCKIRPGGKTPGWKRGISVESLLILMLVHVMDGKGVVFTQMAQTLKYRMGPKQFAAIGISKTTGTYAQWYDRLLNTKDHLETLIDSLPGNRRKIPTEETMVAIARDRADRAS